MQPCTAEPGLLDDEVREWVVRKAAGTGDRDLDYRQGPQILISAL